jgi:hypothetical protein
VPSTLTAQQRGISVRASGDNASTGETAAENARRLDEAVFGLRSRSPELSAATGLWAWQRCVLAAALMFLCLGRGRLRLAAYALLMPAYWLAIS